MKKQFLWIVALSGCILATTACSDGIEHSIVQKDLVKAHHAIMNGTADTKTAHKAVVSLYDKSEKYSFCTGTLIHPQWVITAGHCVASEYSNKLDSKFVSSTQIGIGNNENNLKLYNISKAYLHSSYGDRYINNKQSMYTLEGDIALIKLSESVPSSVAVPILPHPNWLPLESSELPISMEFVGFGYDEDGGSGVKLTYTGDVTQYCPITSSCKVGSGYCAMGSYKVSGCHPSDLNSSGKCKTGTSVSYTDTVYAPCGSFFNPQSLGGTCNGDSGGPAFDTVGGIQYVAGLTSYGDEICTVYGLSTSVLDYQDWIKSYAPEVYEQYVEVCGNGVDDDGDGKTDDDDTDCGGSTVVTAYCGDGIVNNTEECDGTAFLGGKKTCAAWNSKYSSGNVSCSSLCAVDYSACKTASVCGNGILEDGEACDGKNFSVSSTSCADYNSAYESGSLSCTSKCTISTGACEYPAEAVTTDEICNDGIDNDGNGKTDCSDKACYYNEACAEDCTNGKDDDGDGFVDCDDFYCSSAAVCNTESVSIEICNDGKDNDGDGFIDCKDFNCNYDSACAEDCTNGIDDDGDGFVDCKDYYCKSSAACNGGTAVVTTYEICGNGVDDDKNGLTDCADSACADDSGCKSTTVPQDEICDDGIDNDNDGYTDCDDYDCKSDVSCQKSDDDSASTGDGGSTGGDGSSTDGDDGGSTGDDDSGSTDDGGSTGGGSVEIVEPSAGTDDDDENAESGATGGSASATDSGSSSENPSQSGSSTDSSDGDDGASDDSASQVEESKKSNNSSDSCSTAPLTTPAGRAPLSAALLGLFGLLSLARRRNAR